MDDDLDDYGGHDGRNVLIFLFFHAVVWTAVLVGLSYAFVNWLP